ncbi:MAG: hypothetical protein A3G41_00590 [Elusimicrobia bacterium RIFCSPLOWO2_12_FULL_59_9]|nr:MAG: hypothetical protein A3G41_00590 [Elusimicrobia bacterium RIFCSPLOWO2_12_FULL_59_9]
MIFNALKRSTKFRLKSIALAMTLMGLVWTVERPMPGDRQSAYILGKVEISRKLLPEASRPNTVLSVIATDKGGVPVAMKRIINPSFPLLFDLGPDDRLLPVNYREEPLRISAQIITSDAPDAEHPSGGPLRSGPKAVYAHPVRAGGPRIQLHLK